MTLLKYLAERRKVHEEGILRAEGNEKLLILEKSALAELDDFEHAMKEENYYKISTDGENNIFEVHGIGLSTALMSIIQHIVLETITAREKIKARRKGGKR